jgi:transcriptional regulator with XRE-family HTH domain
MKDQKTTKAVDILHRRYIGENVERQDLLETERVNAEAAKAVYDLRKEAGLTQKELAKLIGTTQSVISRLEDADYEGHSLSMLIRIASALNRRLTIKLAEPNGTPLPVKGIQKAAGHVNRGIPLTGHDEWHGLRPGEIAPLSGMYQQIGPRGGRGGEVTAVRGEPLPPTPRRDMTYSLIDVNRPKSRKEKKKIESKSTSKKSQKG